MDVYNNKLGKYGSIWCVGPTTVFNAPTGTFFCALAITETAKFTSLANGTVAVPGSVAAVNTNTTFANASSTLASMSFPAGMTLLGYWTSFNLASGSLIAYKDALKDYQHG